MQPLAASSTPKEAGEGPQAEKTLERLAVDAVAAGWHEKAVELYEKLAKAHPEVPAYAEAARILRIKIEEPR